MTKEKAKPSSEELIGRARQLRREQTEAEKRLWYHQRARRLGGYTFRRQHPVGPFIADFYCEALDLVEQAYRAGARTNLEVIDAHRQAADAGTDLEIAEDAARQARLDLLVAAGRFPAL